MIDPRLIDETIREVISSGTEGDRCNSGLWQCQFCTDRRCPERDVETVTRIIGVGADRVGSSLGVKNPPSSLAELIDHTLLKPEATLGQIRQLCDEAARFRFASVCVNPAFVPYCKNFLKGTSIPIASVVGFPLGANKSEIKAKEAAIAVNDGADELDMVINVGMLKSGEYNYVEDEIAAVVKAARGKAVKVIIEIALLSDEEKIKACILSRDAGAHFVKTSTGFSKSGATVEDVALMRKVVGDKLGVKAAGGIKTYEDALKMVESGANRIGASASVKIVSGEGQT